MDGFNSTEISQLFEDKRNNRLKFSETAKENLIKELEDYVNFRFGKMNKNDFEVLIFHFLLKSNLKNTSNYILSRSLKIPESKIKRLKYEADLIYEPTDFSNLFVNLENVLKKAKFKGTNGLIQLFIEDQSLKEFICNLLNKNNCFADYSENRDILILNFEDLLYIYKEFNEYNEDLEQMLDYAQKIINPDLTMEGLFQNLQKCIIQNGGPLQGSLLGFTVQGIKLLVQKYNKKIYYELAQELK